MNAIAIPETTLKLLEAVRRLNGTSEKLNVARVIISGKGRLPIDYLPMKSKFTSGAIEQAGISELVSRYCFECTRESVSSHFRPGVYDVSGASILVIE